MKFGKRLLAELEQNWADHYLPFKDLKKVIGSDGPDRAERFEAIFRESLRRIQKHTSTVANEVHRDERRATELGQLLKDFLDLNFEGIRKILKKYVKRVGGDAAAKLTRQLQAEAYEMKQDTRREELITAVRDNKLDEVRTLLEKRRMTSSFLDNAYDSDTHNDVLYAAARSGNLEMVRLLLPKASPNLVSHHGRHSKSTALHVAAYRGHLDIVIALREGGCKIIKDIHWSGTSVASQLVRALVYKVMVGYQDNTVDRAVMLCQRWPRDYPSKEACVEDLASIVTPQMASKPRGPAGWTLLHVACAVGNYHALEVLAKLNLGREVVNHADDDGWAPLHYVFARDAWRQDPSSLRMVQTLATMKASVMSPFPLAEDFVRHRLAHRMWVGSLPAQAEPKWREHHRSYMLYASSQILTSVARHGKEAFRGSLWVDGKPPVAIRVTFDTSEGGRGGLLAQLEHPPTADKAGFRWFEGFAVNEMKKVICEVGGGSSSLGCKTTLLPCVDDFGASRVWHIGKYNFHFEHVISVTPTNERYQIKEKGTPKATWTLLFDRDTMEVELCTSTTPEEQRVRVPVSSLLTTTNICPLCFRNGHTAMTYAVSQGAEMVERWTPLFMAFHQSIVLSPNAQRRIREASIVSSFKTHGFLDLFTKEGGLSTNEESFTVPGTLYQAVTKIPAWTMVSRVATFCAIPTSDDDDARMQFFAGILMNASAIGNTAETARVLAFLQLYPEWAKGQMLNFPYKQDVYAVVVAARYGHTIIVKLFKEHGADLMVNAGAALAAAIRFCHYETADYIISSVPRQFCKLDAFPSGETPSEKEIRYCDDNELLTECIEEYIVSRVMSPPPASSTALLVLNMQNDVPKEFAQKVKDFIGEQREADTAAVFFCNSLHHSMKEATVELHKKGIVTQEVSQKNMTRLHDKLAKRNFRTVIIVGVVGHDDTSWIRATVADAALFGIQARVVKDLCGGAPVDVTEDQAMKDPLLQRLFALKSIRYSGHHLPKSFDFGYENPRAGELFLFVCYYNMTQQHKTEQITATIHGVTVGPSQGGDAQLYPLHYLMMLASSSSPATNVYALLKKAIDFLITNRLDAAYTLPGGVSIQRAARDVPKLCNKKKDDIFHHHGWCLGDPIKKGSLDCCPVTHVEHTKLAHILECNPIHLAIRLKLSCVVEWMLLGESPLYSQTSTGRDNAENLVVFQETEDLWNASSATCNNGQLPFYFTLRSLCAIRHIVDPKPTMCVQSTAFSDITRTSARPLLAGCGATIQLETSMVGGGVPSFPASQWLCPHCGVFAHYLKDSSSFQSSDVGELQRILRIFLRATAKYPRLLTVNGTAVPRVAMGHSRLGNFHDIAGLFSPPPMCAEKQTCGLQLLFQCAPEIVPDFVTYGLHKKCPLSTYVEINSMFASSCVFIQRRHLWRVTTGGHELMVYDRLSILQWCALLNDANMLEWLMSFPDCKVGADRPSPNLKYSLLHWAALGCSTNVLTTLINSCYRNDDEKENAMVNRAAGGEFDRCDFEYMNPEGEKDEQCQPFGEGHEALVRASTLRADSALTNDDIKTLEKSFDENVYHDPCVVACGSGASFYGKINSEGETPLHVACSYGHKACVKVLLENGADTSKVTTFADYVDPHDISIYVSFRHDVQKAQDKEIVEYADPYEIPDERDERKSRRESSLLADVVSLTTQQPVISTKLKHYGLARFVTSRRFLYVLFVYFLTAYALMLTETQAGVREDHITSKFIEGIFDDASFTLDFTNTDTGFGKQSSSGHRNAMGLSDLMAWIQAPFRSLLFPGEGSLGLWDDYYRLIGGVRFLQSKVKPVPCPGQKVYPQMENKTCFPTWTHGSSNHTQYPLPGGTPFIVDKGMTPPNLYMSLTGNNIPLTEGFAFDILIGNSTYLDSQFAALESFFDASSRYIVIQFTLYHASTDAFVVVQHVFDSTASHSLTQARDIMPVQVCSWDCGTRANNKTMLFYYAMILVFLLTLVLSHMDDMSRSLHLHFRHLQAKLRDRKKEKWTNLRFLFEYLTVLCTDVYDHFTTDWNIVDFLQILLLGGMVGFDVLLYREGRYMRENFQLLDPEVGFVSFSYLAFYTRIRTSILALAMLISWITLLKRISALPVVGPYTVTIMKCWFTPSVGSFTCIFMIVECGFSFSMNVAFGDRSEAFSSLSNSFMTMTTMMMMTLLQGASNYDVLFQEDHIVGPGPILYILFFVLINILLMNTLIAILAQAYNDRFEQTRETWSTDTVAAYRVDRLHLNHPTHDSVHFLISPFVHRMEKDMQQETMMKGGGVGERPWKMVGRALIRKNLRNAPTPEMRRAEMVHLHAWVVVNAVGE